MVANLSVGKKAYAAVQERVKEVAEVAQDLKDFFLDAIDNDTNSFNAVMDCFRLPKASEEQQRVRNLAIAAATRQATRVPLSVLTRVPQLLELAAEIAEIGNANSLSDAGVAALTGQAGAEGAYYNVLINLESLSELDQSEEPDFGAETRAAATAALESCEQLGLAARQLVRQRLEAAVSG